MGLSSQAIDLFEYLAKNTHHRVSENELLADKSLAMKDIYLSRNAEYLKNHFNATGYFADSVKVTEF